MPGGLPKQRALTVRLVQHFQGDILYNDVIAVWTGRYLRGKDTNQLLIEFLHTHTIHQKEGCLLISALAVRTSSEPRRVSQRSAEIMCKMGAGCPLPCPTIDITKELNIVKSLMTAGVSNKLHLPW
eukprot:2950769-Amphidinium_carterae.1